ncbi:hypothetical protein [Bacillus cereus group sp. BfR-BA-01379]|uniref:hypothetical protein n=1 Tax=Bacillus cereus group sp. BfR-BA-01379 TaxID=2920323 RepID=UPI0028BE5ADB|nr:hypothetical protein [Bacillus cereus group sp. BfR-BA-01379]
MKGGIKECPGKMIAGVLRKKIVVMTGGNLKKSIAMMIGGNLKKSIAMMIGVLNKISVAVNVSLFVVIVKGNIGNILSVNLKERICFLGPINTKIYKKLTKYSQLFIYSHIGI